MPRTRLFHLRIMTLNHFKRSYAFTFYGVISFILLTHCQPSSEKNVNDGVVNLLPLDTLYLDIPDGFGSGFTTMANDSLYFFDQVSGRVYSFDTNGRYGSKKLGIGNGPKEVTGIDAYLYADGLHIIMHGWTVFIFDKNWHRINQFKINFDVKQNITTLERDPKPEYHGIYEVKYFENQLALYDENHLLFNIESTHPKFNAFISEKYYAEGRTLASLNLSTGKVDTIFGDRSPEYLKHQFIPNNDFQYYDFVNDTFYVNYEPDSMIYVFDKNFTKINEFGKGGYDMNTDYELTKTLNAAFDQNKFFIDRTEKGYYTYVKAFPDQKKTLRIYTLGTDSEDLEELFQVKKRMQVYENFDFREEWDLPQTRFKVLGYVNDHYYADGLPDYDNNRVGIYRFKL